VNEAARLHCVLVFKNSTFMIAHQYKKYYFYRDVIILDFKIVLKLALYNIVEKPNVGVSTVQAKLTVK
jgi:hypothetical protein